MTNYDIGLVKCICVNCGKTFGCIRAVWFCKECDKVIRDEKKRKK